jgi:hypothetical protein
MADLDKTDPLASMLGDGYSKLDQTGKVAAAGSFLKSRDEADKTAKGEAGKRAESQIISEFGPSLYSKPYEEFKPSQESMSGFAALGSLMMVAGTMMGSKGRLAGIGAMNNIAGMLKGYQSGRKDLYEQERQQFEENMKIQERNRADIKEAFNLALKMAPTNLRGAEDFLNKTFASKGMTMPQAMLKTSGVMHTIGTVNGALDRADDITKQIADSLGYKGVTSRKDLEARIAAQAAGTTAQSAAKKEDVASQIQALDLKTKQQVADRGGLSESELRDKRAAEALAADPNNIQTESEKDLVAKWTGKVFPVKEKVKTDEFKGQRKFVASVIGDEVNDLGAKELPKVSATIEAVRQTNELADAVAKNPQAAGIVGNTIKFFDRYLPGRYQGTDEADPGRLAALASADDETFKGIPQDQISEARKIQKMVVDVINARALAASNGGRMLIAEFNAQKNVLGLGDLSAKSAIDVYRGLADRDARSLRQYGLSNDAIQSVIGKNGGIIDVSNEDEASALPVGFRFRLPDGRTGVVE